jgi:ABC-type Na+ transport system ATPase subunit NatA
MVTLPVVFGMDCHGMSATQITSGTYHYSVGGRLELDGLTRRYGPVTALDDLSFSVPAGQVMGFLGPNGAGKTTTMRAVLGLTDLDAGTVRWNGAPVGPAERRRFGYTLEERGLYPGMVVSEQLVYLGRLHGMSAPEAAAATRARLERLGVADRAASKVESLSHGNEQRVQLAAALVHGPELLILDEPFAGLDPAGIDAPGDVLAGQARSGRLPAADGAVRHAGPGGSRRGHWWEFAASAAISVLCTVGVARIATGIYRRAILRNGRRVRLREIVSGVAR